MTHVKRANAAAGIRQQKFRYTPLPRSKNGIVEILILWKYNSYRKIIILVNCPFPGTAITMKVLTMKIRFGFLLAFIAVFLTGCATAPQSRVSLSQDAFTPKSGRIGVAMTALPKVETQYPGAGCLLCIAAAYAANSSLNAHSKTLSYEDIPNLKSEIANVIRNKGADVVVISEELNINDLGDFDKTGPNIARKDFSPLSQKYKLDKLIVVQINSLGFTRSYSSYIPTSAPVGMFNGVGFMVNLKNNTYEWYQPVSITRGAGNNWDEPPSFPGLTNAYYQSLEIGKEAFIKSFTGNALPLSAAAVTVKSEFPISRP